jgi:hypothetical protein
MAKITRPTQISLLLICAWALTACGAPLLHSDNEAFAPAPEVISKIQPYLDQWATLPPSDTKAQRDKFSQELNVVINVWTWDRTSSGRPIPVVEIMLYTWGGYRRGYLYIRDNHELVARYKWQLRPVDDHLYLYNANE